MKFEHFEVMTLDNEEKIRGFIQFLEDQISMAPVSVSFAVSIKMQRDVDFIFADEIPHPCVGLSRLSSQVRQEKVAEIKENDKNDEVISDVAKKEDHKSRIKKRRRRRRYAVDASEFKPE